ncbi:hypothetical protein F753_12390 [Stutzerimonas chloritidismutans AW-1]|uniref:Uncharacterized protein n=1 Tax=Stutzerimonas chloritidismutans AW-1 TaxID=1263865 RepID=V4Q8U7_STUCH|nr:hypothetical protein F753_12390 [Stutzerimonas chloritidismutans AW-1]
MLMNRGLDGCKNIRICFSARNLSGRYSRRRLSDEAAGEVGHQANAEDQQNEKGEDETDAEQHEFDAFEQELAGGHREFPCQQLKLLVIRCVGSARFATHETAEP